MVEAVVLPHTVIACGGRLGDRWFDSSGQRFVFCFWSKGQRPALRILVHSGSTSTETDFRSGWGPQTPKVALPARETSRFAYAVWVLGVFWGACGQVRAAARDVN